MTETDPLKQLAQLEGYNTIRSDHVRQMQLLRYWADELATPRHADPKRLLALRLQNLLAIRRGRHHPGDFQADRNRPTAFSSNLASNPASNAIPSSFWSRAGVGSGSKARRRASNRSTKISKRFSMSAGWRSAKPSSPPRISMRCSNRAASPARSIFSASISTTTTTGSGRRSR